MNEGTGHGLQIRANKEWGHRARITSDKNRNRANKEWGHRARITYSCEQRWMWRQGTDYFR